MPLCKPKFRIYSSAESSAADQCGLKPSTALACEQCFCGMGCFGILATVYKFCRRLVTSSFYYNARSGLYTNPLKDTLIKHEASKSLTRIRALITEQVARDRGSVNLTHTQPGCELDWFAAVKRSPNKTGFLEHSCTRVVSATL